MDAIKSIKKYIILFPPPHLTNILFRNFYLLPLYRRRFHIERQSLFNFSKNSVHKKKHFLFKESVSFTRFTFHQFFPDTFAVDTYRNKFLYSQSTDHVSHVR